MAEDWIVLDEVAGMLQAEILRGLLEAQEISTVLSQEGAGRAIGLTIGTLGTVQILIPSKWRGKTPVLTLPYEMQTWLYRMG